MKILRLRFRLAWVPAIKASSGSEILVSFIVDPPKTSERDLQSGHHSSHMAARTSCDLLANCTVGNLQKRCHQALHFWHELTWI
jgi:hypothetical protein